MKPNWIIFFSPGTYVCVYDIENFSLRGFHISFFITSFSLPLVFILLMYVVMLLRLWRTSSCNVSREGMKAKKRVTKLVLAVIMVFTVCWAPIQLVLILKSTSDNNDWERDYRKLVIQIMSHVLAYTNSCLNPLLYAKMSRNFRTGFAQVLPLKFLQKHLSSLKYEMTTERRQSRQNGSKKAPAREADKENGGRSVGVVRAQLNFEETHADAESPSPIQLTTYTTIAAHPDQELKEASL